MSLLGRVSRTAPRTGLERGAARGVISATAGPLNRWRVSFKGARLFHVTFKMPGNLHEHHLTVARTARYYTLGPAAGGAREVWFVCHGYGQLAGEFLRAFQALDDGTRLFVAPEALNRYYVEDSPGPHGPHSPVGATWMTREDRLAEISDYVEYLDTLCEHLLGVAFPTAAAGHPAATVFALGFSQGAATASRWAALGRSRIGHLILWGAAFPPDLDLEATRARLETTRISLVAGESDHYLGHDRLAKEENRLRQHGIACRLLTFPGGHRLDDATLLGLAAAAHGQWSSSQVR